MTGPPRGETQERGGGSSCGTVVLCSTGSLGRLVETQVVHRLLEFLIQRCVLLARLPVSLVQGEIQRGCSKTLAVTLSNVDAVCRP